MPAALEIALLEDPRIAALWIGKHFPGVVVAVPEKEAVGAVALRGLADLVQAPLRRLLVAKAPGRIDFGVALDVDAVVIAARHALLVLRQHDSVHVLAAEARHQRHRAGAHHFEPEELLVEAARRL